LILEDDVAFSLHRGARTLARIAAALEKLPADWMGFYLGHWPLRAHFVRASVLESASLCTHAYVASERLLAWLCDNPYEQARPRGRSFRRFVSGAGIDAAYSRLGGMYAFFPMVALQAESPGNHPLRGSRAQRSWLYALRLRMRDVLLLRHMRTAESLAVAASPFSWLASRVQAQLGRVGERAQHPARPFAGAIPAAWAKAHARIRGRSAAPRRVPATGRTRIRRGPG